ncbi:MAG: hypothetical protein WCO08_06665 [Actinomycetes bacterium]
MRNYRLTSVLVIGALLAVLPAQAMTVARAADQNATTACTEIMVGINVANKLITMTKSKSQINPLATSSVNTMIMLAQTPLKAAINANPALKSLLPNLATIQKYATTGKLTSAVIASLKNVTTICAGVVKK